MTGNVKKAFNAISSVIEMATGEENAELAGEIMNAAGVSRDTVFIFLQALEEADREEFLSQVSAFVEENP